MHGRYTQSDPVGFDGGPNGYAYAENEPLNLMDPEGLKLPMARPSTREMARADGTWLCSSSR